MTPPRVFNSGICASLGFQMGKQQGVVARIASRHNLAVVRHRLAVMGDDDGWVDPATLANEACGLHPANKADGHSSPPSVASAIFSSSTSLDQPMNGFLPMTAAYSSRSALI